MFCVRNEFVALILIAVVAGLLVGYFAAPKQQAVRISALSEETALSVPSEYEVVELAIPAVDADGNGKLAKIIVELRPKTSQAGRIFLNFDENAPIVNDETQESLKTAIAVAKKYSLKDPNGYDLHYSMVSPSSVVGGQSAGAAMAVATMAVLQGRKLRGDVVITGVVNNDGTISKVGGVLEKARAIKSAGSYKQFIVPVGESTIQEIAEECDEQKTPFSVVRKCSSKPSTVSIAAQTGLDVVEARDVLQAFDLMVQK